MECVLEDRGRNFDPFSLTSWNNGVWNFTSKLFLGTGHTVEMSLEICRENYYHSKKIRNYLRKL